MSNGTRGGLEELREELRVSRLCFSAMIDVRGMSNVRAYGPTTYQSLGSTGWRGTRQLPKPLGKKCSLLPVQRHRLLLAQLHIHQPAATPAPATAVLAAAHCCISPPVPSGLDSCAALPAVNDRHGHAASNACPRPYGAAAGPHDGYESSQLRQTHSSPTCEARGRPVSRDAGALGTGRCASNRAIGQALPKGAADGQSTGKTTAAPASADAGAVRKGSPRLRPPWRGPLSRSPPSPRHVGAREGRVAAVAPNRKPLSASGADKGRDGGRAGQHQTSSGGAAAVAAGQHAVRQGSCPQARGARPTAPDAVTANCGTSQHAAGGAHSPGVDSSTSACAVACTLAEAASTAALSVLVPLASLPPAGNSPLGRSFQTPRMTRMLGGGPEAAAPKAGSARSPIHTCTVGVQVSPEPVWDRTAHPTGGQSVGSIKAEARGRAVGLAGGDHEPWNVLGGAASALPYSPGALQQSGVPGRTTVTVSPGPPGGTAAPMPTQVAFPAVDRALQRRARLAALWPGAVGTGHGTSPSASTGSAAARQQGSGSAAGHSSEAPDAIRMCPLPCTPSRRLISPRAPGPFAEAGVMNCGSHGTESAGSVAAAAACSVAAAAFGRKEGIGGRSCTHGQGATAPQDAYGAIREWRQRRAKAAAIICAAMRRFLNGRYVIWAQVGWRM